MARATDRVTAWKPTGAFSREGGACAAASPAVRRVVVLGSTGSIGTQTLEVIEHLNRLHERGEHPTRYEVVGLAARRNAALLCEQAERFGLKDPEAVGCADEAVDCPRAALRGAGAAEGVVRGVEADLVVAAMVGVAGLPATLAAVELGRDVALANKETLVAAGALVVPAARASGARLLPLDSEHAALWQCLQDAGAGGAGAGVGVGEGGAACPPMELPKRVRSLVLTASGGPFRRASRAEIEHATPEQALAHPTWSMGSKVTIDSASLTNKALEVIEAHWLFGAGPERLEVVVHPQSIVHSLVRFVDGNLIAQLGRNDMRIPIQTALTFPGRAEACAEHLDLTRLGRLEFEEPDPERFPALDLAWEVMERGGTAGAVFNAANESAVEAFLAGRIRFGGIYPLVQGATEALSVGEMGSLEACLAADAAARRWVEERVAD